MSIPSLKLLIRYDSSESVDSICVHVHFFFLTSFVFFFFKLILTSFGFSFCLCPLIDILLSSLLVPPGTCCMGNYWRNLCKFSAHLINFLHIFSASRLRAKGMSLSVSSKLRYWLFNTIPR